VKNTVGPEDLELSSERALSEPPPTTAKTSPAAAFVWTLSDQVNAVPANDWNQASFWG
jgi:hypothetical protein